MLTTHRSAALRLPARRSPLLRRAGVGLAAALLLALAPRASAQEPLIYGLNQNGKLVLNGTVLDALTTAFDPSSTTNTHSEQIWWDLAVLGKDRYALRLDGRVSKDGANLYKLPFVLMPAAPVWLSLSVTPTTVFAVREDGLLSGNGTSVQTFPPSTFFFDKVLGADPHVYVLRSDGAIFQDTSATTALIKFAGGAGLGGALDGAQTETRWVTMAINPTTGEIYGLRRDGIIFKQDPAAAGTPPLPGQNVVALPFPPSTTDPASITDSERYVALGFTDDGTWHALRGDGSVFTSASAITPLIDLPGDQTGAPNEIFLDIATTSAGFFATRWDGKVYNQDGGSPLFDMPGSSYRQVVQSDTPPDLTNFKNPPPLSPKYKARTIEHASITVPILASDVEKLPADLVLTAPTPLPPGAAWDDVARTITWADPTPVGTYKFSYTVDDGVNKPVKFNSSIKVIAADTNTLKNKAPLPTHITKVTALVGFPVTFPILATDPDGDPVTISVNTAKPPFSIGATFDTPTNTFSWTPTFDQIGSYTANFKVSDGAKTVTLAVSIKVINGLVF